MHIEESRESQLVGGVDTQKDLHVAAVVEEQDVVPSAIALQRPGKDIGEC